MQDLNQPFTHEERLSHLFTYHPPTPADTESYEMIREAAKKLARCILILVPPGPDQSDALRKVREAVMTANAGIALDGRA